MEPKDLSDEVYREYDFGGRVYRIDSPMKFYMREGGTTHRIVDVNGLVHCVPAPSATSGCVLRWMPKDAANPVQW